MWRHGGNGDRLLVREVSQEFKQILGRHLHEAAPSELLSVIQTLSHCFVESGLSTALRDWRKLALANGVILPWVLAFAPS